MSTLTITTSENATAADRDTAWTMLGQLVELTAQIGRAAIAETEIDLASDVAQLFLVGDELDAWEITRALVTGPPTLGLWFEPGTGELYRVGSSVTPDGLRWRLFTLANPDDNDVASLPKATTHDVIYWF